MDKPLRNLMKKSIKKAQIDIKNIWNTEGLNYRIIKYIKIIIKYFEWLYGINLKT